MLPDFDWFECTMTMYIVPAIAPANAMPGVPLEEASESEAWAEFDPS